MNRPACGDLCCRTNWVQDLANRYKRARSDLLDTVIEQHHGVALTVNIVQVTLAQQYTTCINRTTQLWAS